MNSKTYHGAFEELSFSFAEGGTCVNGKLCHEGFQCSHCLEINSAGYLIVHVLHKIDPCGGPRGNPSSLEVFPSLC